jgi:hypothetical protein
MPTHKCFGLNDSDGVDDRGKPSIQLDEEPSISVREPHAAAQLAPQYDQLMSQRRVLGFKSALRLKWRGVCTENLNPAVMMMKSAEDGH